MHEFVSEFIADGDEYTVFDTPHGCRVDRRRRTRRAEHSRVRPDQQPLVAASLDECAGAGRYLDYCSEMLSLTSRIAASFVQSFNDPIVLSTVNEIETLATGLSGKIWQKITLLERVTTRTLL
jgi:hypothetical protein